MSVRSLIFTVFLKIFSMTAIAQFEGSMEMKVTGDNGDINDTIHYTMSIKNNLMAAEIMNTSRVEETSKFIFRGDKQVIWIINDEEKTYLELSLKDDGKSLKSEGDSRSKKPDTKIIRTGNKETILGYPAEEVIIEGEDQVTHIWGTTKLGNIYAAIMKSFEGLGGDEGETGGRGWDDEIAKLNMFPLKIISKENGEIVLTQEVIRIEQKSILAATFELPKDYKRQTLDFNMENMMKQLQKGMKENGEADGDDPGINVDMEKLMKQLKDAQIEDADTSDTRY